MATRKLFNQIKFTGTGTAYTFHAKYRKYLSKFETANKIENVVINVLSDTGVVIWLVESCGGVTNRGFISRLGSIKLNTKPGGKTYAFELAVNTLKPARPIMKRQKQNGGADDGSDKHEKKWKNTSISENVSFINVKNGKGLKIRVDLKWYSNNEYNKLKQAERIKFTKWYKTENGSKVKRNNANGWEILRHTVPSHR